MAPVVGLGAAGQGVIWDPPPAVASLSLSWVCRRAFITQLNGRILWRILLRIYPVLCKFMHHMLLDS